MSYRLVPTPTFLKGLKKLAKKHPSIFQDLEELEEDLINNPTLGKEVFKNCYKIRVRVKSKGKGKSGGARLITYVKLSAGYIYLLSIFDKSDQESVTDSYIKALLEKLNE